MTTREQAEQAVTSGQTLFVWFNEQYKEWRANIAKSQEESESKLESFRAKTEAALYQSIVERLKVY